MSDKDKFKERAYKILYKKYRDILSGIIQRSYNLEYRSRDTGELLKEDRPEYIDGKVELAEDLSKIDEEWIRKGFISESDMEVIKTLEHCLGEHPFFKTD